MEPCCAFVSTCVGVFWLVPLLPLGFFGVSCMTGVVCVFWVPSCFVLCLGLLLFDLMWNRIALLFRLRLCCVVLFLWVLLMMFCWFFVFNVHRHFLKVLFCEVCFVWSNRLRYSDL